MKLLFSVAIVALCLFAQIANAQDEDKVAAAHSEANKQEDEEVKLDSRYGGQRVRDGRRKNYYNLLGNDKESRIRENINSNIDEKLRGENGGGGRNRIKVIVQNRGVTNKVVRGYTQVLPTVETHSRERHDVRSESNSYFRQNSASKITQNNKRKQTFIHTHLNQVYYHPRHVNHIHKHHHTTFVKQLFPEVKKVYISQKQKIIEPEKLTIIKYTQDTSFENKVYRTKTQRAVRNQVLHTIRKPVLDLGVKNIGNPIDSVKINFNNAVGTNGERFETSNRGGGIRGANKYLLGDGRRISGESGRQGQQENGLGKKTSEYENLKQRADEHVEQKEVEAVLQPSAAAAQAVEVQQTVVEQAAPNKLEQRSASIIAV